MHTKNTNAGVLVNVLQVDKNNIGGVVLEFSNLLDDFPDPYYKWLDERLPHEQPGPGTWVCELLNDQETAFQFFVNHLDEDAKTELFDAIEEIITSDRQGLSFGGEARFNLIYYAVVRFAPRHGTKVTHITYHVYWELAE